MQLEHIRICLTKNKNGEELTANVYIIFQTFLRTPSRTRSRIAGTAAINVGINTVASPLVPLFILFEVSVRVKGDPYPIEPPMAGTIF